jgi:hypothetical protein
MVTHKYLNAANSYTSPYNTPTFYRGKYYNKGQLDFNIAHFDSTDESTTYETFGKSYDYVIYLDNEVCYFKYFKTGSDDEIFATRFGEFSLTKNEIKHALRLRIKNEFDFTIDNTEHEQEQPEQPEQTDEYYESDSETTSYYDSEEEEEEEEEPEQRAVYHMIFNKETIENMELIHSQDEIHEIMQKLIESDENDLGRPMTYSEMRERWG